MKKVKNMKLALINLINTFFFFLAALMVFMVKITSSVSL